MTPEQALSELHRVCGMLPLARAEHAKVDVLVSIIFEAIRSEPCQEEKNDGK